MTEATLATLGDLALSLLGVVIVCGALWVYERPNARKRSTRRR